MYRFLLNCTLIGTTLAFGATAAEAARWQSINQRQANLYQRIDQGVHNGSLTRREASQIRTRFANLNRLEYRYRRSGRGLTAWERSDLNARLDTLSRAIRNQKHDWQDRRR